MRVRPFLLLGTALALLALTAAPVPARTPAPAGGRAIVVLRDAGIRPMAVARAHGLRRADVDHVYRHVFTGYAGHFSGAVLAALAADPRVERVIPDAPVRMSETQRGVTWGLDRLDQGVLPLTRTYRFRTTGAGVTAYILDTGIRTSHVEFEGRAVDGFDAVDGELPADDCNGHGTHVAGIVGGATSGVAKDVRLVAVRVLDCTGAGTFAGVIAGVDWITGDHQPGQPAVANLSLTGGVYPLLDAAITASIADGIVHTIAAGNSTADACGYSPARVPAAITVGATTDSDARAMYSNHGPCVDLHAPGTWITSAWATSDTATALASGTSMAAPHVAGAAARFLQTSPAATPREVRAALVRASIKDRIGGLRPQPYRATPNRLLHLARTS